MRGIIISGIPNVLPALLRLASAWVTAESCVKQNNCPQKCIFFDCSTLFDAHRRVGKVNSWNQKLARVTHVPWLLWLGPVRPGHLCELVKKTEI